MAFERGRAPPGSVERRRLPEIDVDQLLEDGPPSSQAGCLDQNTIPGAHETDDQGLTESGEWSTLLEDLEASEAQRKQKLRAKLLKDSEDAMSEIVPGSPDPNHSKRSSLEEPSRGDIIQDLLDNKKTVPAPLDQTSFGDDVRTDQSGSKVWQSGDTMLDKTSETDLAQDTVPSRTDSNNRASERRMWLRLCFAFLVATIMSALVVVSFASILLYWENIDGLLQAEFLGGDQRTGCKVLSRDVDLRSAKLCGTDALRALQPAAGPAGAAHRQTKGELCRFVYYWVAVLQVEFWPKSASLPMRAFAEKPGALLVESCRPGFREVWNVKEGYRINGTYACTYNQAHLQQVDLEGRNFSRCPQTPGVRQAYEANVLNPLAGKLLELMSNIGTAYRSFADLLSPKLYASDKLLERGLWLFFVFVASLRLTQRLSRKRAATVTLLNPTAR